MDACYKNWEVDGKKQYQKFDDLKKIKKKKKRNSSLLKLLDGRFGDFQEKNS